MMRWLIALLCMTICGARAGETWILYHAPGADVEALRGAAVRVAPADVTISSQCLPTSCESADDLNAQRSAIGAGVHMLPCLGLQDAEGCYAVLPLHGLSAQGVHTARDLARAPRRRELEAQRLLAADLYYDTACVHLPFIPQRDKAAAVAHLQTLAESLQFSVDTRQFIALRCLYPSLMRLYAAEYNGAHTPTSERLFLQAISALELARDLDTSSELGRQAHQERESLRAARLQSKSLD